ncbi:right-handed parallel beta-helix repeat-containing protein [Opitutaceae bacterium TAV4]|nr:right-handed parallel beta-helix repeat-containing protein [Opitutaceae bacterium TAV4]
MCKPLKTQRTPSRIFTTNTTDRTHGMEPVTYCNIQMDTTAARFAVALFATALTPVVPTNARILHVNNAHPLAADPGASDVASATTAASGVGTTGNPFRTIGAAAAFAQPGDTVYVHPGIYREHIAPERGGTANAPITYEAAPGHQVFVRGSEIWTPDWSPVADAPDGVYSARLDDALFAAPGITRNPYRSLVRSSSKPYDAPARPIADFGELTKKWLANKQPGRLPRTCGQLFVDGAPLLESETVAEVLRVPGTWIVDEAGERIIAHFPPSHLPPARRFVELSVRDRIFAPARRGLRHIIVRGFVFEHAANQGLWPQLGAVSLRSGSRWLVENNIIRHAKTIGMDAGSEGYGSMLQRLALTGPDQQRAITGRDNVIRNNVISDNGMSGLIAWHCHGIVIEGNRIERNNALEFKTGRDHYIPWWEQAGIKLHAAIGARIEGNLIRDNQAHGIFIDNEYKNARVTKNIVLNNAGAGVMFELGHGPAVIDNNIIAFSRGLSEFFGGDGIYGQDASGVTVAHNLLYSNIRHGVYFRHNENRNSGARRPSAAAGNRVLNNLIFDNAASAINLPADGPTTGENFSDYNIISQRLARFIANQVAKTTPRGAPSVQDEFRRRLSPGGDAAGAASRKDYSTWTPGDGLTFAEWRALTGRDKHSIIQNPKLIVIRPATLEAEFFPGAQKISTDYDSRIDVKEEKADGLPYAGLRAPPVALPQGVAGSPLPSDDKGVIPGPWQFLKNHNQRFFLWATPTTTSPSPATSATSIAAPPAGNPSPPPVAAMALPEKPEDLFRLIGDTRPIRLVLNDAAVIPANKTFAYSYSDYSGNTLATGDALCDPATRVLTPPPPPPASQEHRAVSWN